MAFISTCDHLTSTEIAAAKGAEFLHHHEGADVCTLKLSSTTFFVQEADEELMLAYLERAAHFFRKRINKRKRGRKPGCHIRIDLSVSGGTSYPSAAPLAAFLDHAAKESKSLDAALNGNTLDHINVQVTND